MYLLVSLYLLFAFNHLTAVNAYAADKALTVNYPPDNTVREYDILSVSLKVDLNKVERIKAWVDRREKADIVPDQEFECFSLPLRPGLNKIEIAAIQRGKKLEEAVFYVFQRSDLAKIYMKAPDGFKKDYFHMSDSTACAACHKMDPVEYDKMPINPQAFSSENFDREKVFSLTSTCYSCHNKITSRAYVHGPAAVWSCLSCHNEESKPLYSVKKPDTETCFMCHVEQKMDWDSKKFAHGPVTIGRCTICHSPHSADNPFNLFKSTWALCTNCHKEKGSGKHVLGDSFSTEGHPTRNRKDPLRKGKELSCASCHEPHASNFPHLWAFDVQNLFELCRKCHYDK